MTDLEKLLDSLRIEHAAQIAEATAASRRADILAARIQGIEEAREWQRCAVVEGQPVKRARQPRRDIVAMVEAWLSQEGIDTSSEVFISSSWIENIANSIGCRKSQVEAAMNKINRNAQAAS